MTKKETPIALVGMEQARRRLERWRATRIVGSPLPEKLWVMAVELARRHGVYPTARALGLEYNKLKRLRGHADGMERATPPRTFVELSVPQPADVAGCRIELTRPGGSSVKIELAAPISASLVVELCRVTWGDAG